ncbi:MULTISPECIES: MerR family transcriptional regulator [Paenibacillus]|uniref:MerR family DNA-binding transcriptional regulator n=1 Tax=Paenibacillus campinasensis TaxID=66347 RepID=A0A268EQR4_9BACL|nr:MULTISPECIES: MerR family transcriptional regulator [Paenibacillus]MUG65430.1 MerR family transcriptional regulator [Paenibacillus campinasensis]PAD75437.1 MerR family DNA-binding transcriptional regulator [Paenibacillus campinasensis]PAK51421.1 MerR family DNA-binding transcriptional regulator [Paenibacillus sp. 7541]
MESKVMSIGVVCELTGLSERQIRYYEERKLVFPARTKGGNRRYSFEDVQKLQEIHQKMQEGFNTFELKEIISPKTKRCAPAYR